MDAAGFGFTPNKCHDKLEAESEEAGAGKENILFNLEDSLKGYKLIYYLYLPIKHIQCIIS